MSIYNTAARKAAEKVQPLYVANEWKLISAKGFGVPSVDELEYLINYLIEDVIEHNYERASTGRITVQRHNDENGEKEVEIFFDLATIYSYGEVFA